jgi:hypothetical protein
MLNFSVSVGGVLAIEHVFVVLSNTMENGPAPAIALVAKTPIIVAASKYVFMGSP